MKADREYLEQQQQLDTRVDPNKGYSSLLTTVLDTEAEGYDQASEVPAPTATTTKRLPLAVPVVPGAGLSSLSLKRPQIKTNSQSAAMDEADELIEGGTHFLQSERPEDVEEFEDMFA
ncbi:hypothetical protein AGDE_13616 [Angomonas deanei]|uniref:Uncharacterized protein n=1 Tax=Angomonas deanei TaxID=59799 RepID=A0A7G2C8Y2_9TRYP|nr:hypothetical protein AGDE_13616 [Angomonas deanei]CAD2215223.1 hypothetical protein, conserved [Angomonas deanei]|eukprot:EPY22016.1 hypothetical protein AGDE_13616 [Angomonas deanei]